MTRDLSKKDVKIALFGVGSLGRVLLSRFTVEGYSVSVYDADETKSQQLGDIANAVFVKTPEQAVEAADIVLIAVKPYHLADLAASISGCLGSETSVVSMAAGVSLAMLSAWFPGNRVMRAMPNLACEVGMSLTAYVGDPNHEVEALLRCLGKVIAIDESAMHLFTGLAGSGPAFIARILNQAVASLISSQSELDPEVLQQWLLSMVRGTAEVLLERNISLDAFEQSVAAPNGTTIAGLEAGQHTNQQSSQSGEVFDLAKAILAAAERSAAIEKETN